MRIGLIAPPGVPVPPPAYGGTESVIDRLARGLVGVRQRAAGPEATSADRPMPTRRARSQRGDRGRTTDPHERHRTVPPGADMDHATSTRTTAERGGR